MGNSKCGSRCREERNRELLVHAWSFLPGQRGCRELEGESILKCVFSGGGSAMSVVAQNPGQVQMSIDHWLGGCKPGQRGPAERVTPLCEGEDKARSLVVRGRNE